MRERKKILLSSILIACLLSVGFYVYQSTLSNTAIALLGDKLINTSSSTIVASAYPAKSTNTVNKKYRTLSEREKYELYLHQHPYKNRVSNIDASEVETELEDNTKAKRKEKSKAKTGQIVQT